MSGNHPDAIPISMMNPYEDSLHDADQEIVQIAPSESNFQTKVADAATRKTWTWSFIASSPKTMYSNRMMIQWEAWVRIPEEANFPPMFAPVSMPLAKICQTFSLTINGKTITNDAWLEYGILERELDGDYANQSRCMEPRQPVRGACIGEIPVCGAQSMSVHHFAGGSHPALWPSPDYYFGGKFAHKFDGNNLQTEGQFPNRTAFNPTRYFTTNQHRPISNKIVTEENKNYRLVKYQFVSPIPHELFMHRDEHTMVNLSNMQFQFQFHNNLLGRLFAWRGDFTSDKHGNTLPANQIVCSIEDFKPQLLYHSITSANEASLPSSQTIMFNQQRLVRETYTDQLLPPDGRQAGSNLDFTPANMDDDNDWPKKQVMMKPVRLGHVPTKIRLWAGMNEAWFEKARQFKSNVAAPTQAVLNEVGDQGQYTYTFATAATKTMFADAFANPTHYVWYFEDGEAGKFKPVTNIFREEDDAFTYHPEGTVGGHASVQLVKARVQAALLNGWTTNDGNQDASMTRGLARLAIVKVGDPGKVVTDASAGWGCEMPLLHVSDIRITLNNKPHILMCPDTEHTDLFYHHMCHKNGLLVDYSDFLRGGPIVIDVGKDLASRGLVTGASGQFDCQITFTVRNHVRENAINAFRRQRMCIEEMGCHPYMGLDGGFAAYAMFEHPVALTIEPGLADISIGIPFSEIEKATEAIIPRSVANASAYGPLAAGGKLFDGKMKVRNAWNAGKKALNKGKKMHEQAKAAYQQGKALVDQGKQIHDAVKGVVGAGGNMYG